MGFIDHTEKSPMELVKQLAILMQVCKIRKKPVIIILLSQTTASEINNHSLLLGLPFPAYPDNWLRDVT